MDLLPLTAAVLALLALLGFAGVRPALRAAGWWLLALAVLLVVIGFLL